MKLNEETIQIGMQRFERMTERKTLPSWDELPTIELYMDQVIALVNGYLSFFSGDENEPIITHSMINNYVKLKIIPIPVKKRYSRKHLICLIMIGTLKQSLSIPSIEFLLPNECDEDEAKRVYNKFVISWENSFDMANEMIESQLKEMVNNKKFDEAYDLATDMAVCSNVFKVFTEKMIGLHPDRVDIDKKSDMTDKPKKEKKKLKDKASEK